MGSNSYNIYLIYILSIIYALVHKFNLVLEIEILTIDIFNSLRGFGYVPYVAITTWLVSQKRLKNLACIKITTFVMIIKIKVSSPSFLFSQRITKTNQREFFQWRI